MKTLEEIYSYRFFRSRHKLMWRIPVICEPIAELTRAKSVVDVGCAIGDLVKGFLDMGLDAWGIEGSTAALSYVVAPLEKIFFQDIRNTVRPAELMRKFDLVLCLEVLEHIEEEFADSTVNLLASMSQEWIITSAAPPGQSGTSHVNLQPLQYWIQKFSRIGFNQDIPVKEALLSRWEPYRKKDGVRAYYNNLIVCRRQS